MDEEIYMAYIYFLKYDAKIKYDSKGRLFLIFDDDSIDYDIKGKPIIENYGQVKNG